MATNLRSDRDTCPNRGMEIPGSCNYECPYCEGFIKRNGYPYEVLCSHPNARRYEDLLGHQIS